MNVSGVAPSQSVPNSQDRDDIGLGQPAYLPNQDETIPVAGTSDSITTSGRTAGVTPRIMSGSVQRGDSPEYLDNSNNYGAALNGADAMDQAGGTVDGLMNGISGNDFILQEGDYQTVDGDKLAWLMDYIAKLSLGEMQIRMVLEASEEISDKLMEILLQLKPDESDTDSGREAFMKSMQQRMKILQQFMSSLYSAVYNSNFAIWQEKMTNIDKGYNGRSWLTKVGDFFSGGQSRINAERKKLAETKKYNEAQKKNLEELRRALVALARSAAAMGGSGEGLAKALNGLDAKIAEAEAKMAPRKVGEIFGTPLYVYDYFDDDDSKNFLQGILTDLRKGMVGLQNTARAKTYVETAQMEESQSVMEILLDLSPHASKAQYAFTGQETFFNLVNAFFDTSFSSLSNRIQTHNTEITIRKNIEKLEAAQGWAILGSALQVGGVIAATIIVCATWGEGVILAPAIVGGASAAAGALAQSYGAYEAAQVPDHYDMSAPIFSAGKSSYSGPARNVQETINDEEYAEERLFNDMGNSQLYFKNNDGFYTVNSTALAAFELTQQQMQNIAKMMVYLHKAMRDISRAVDAVIMEYTAKDFGDSYLIGNLENSLKQRQMVMRAITAQINEQVAGKNLARQNELMAHKAFGTTGWSLAGMAAGLGIAFIPGMAPFAGILMAVGGAMGSTGYQIYDLENSQYSSLHNNFKEDTSALTQKLDQINRQDANSTVAEDKLNQREYALYCELMANGYVSTGDGYHGVNYGLVGKIYNELMSLQSLRETLAVLREGQAKISAAVRQEITGVAGSVSELGKIITQGSFSRSMTIMQGIVRFIADKAQVMNRRRDAEKQMNMAITTGAIEVGVAAAGSIAAMSAASGSGPLGQAMQASAASTAVLSLTPSVMNLSSAAFSISQNWGYANSGYGDYDNFSDSDKTVKDIKGGQVQEEGDDPFTQLNNMESQVYLDAGEELAKSLCGDTWQLDGGVTGTLTARLHVLSNLRKMLMTLVEAQTSISAGERRSLKAGGSQGVEQLEELAAQRERTAQNILNSLVEGMEVIVERHNQMSEAKAQIVASSINAAMSIVSMALAAAAAVKHAQMMQAAKEARSGGGQTSSARPTQLNNQTATAAKAAPVGESAAPRPGTPAKAANQSAAAAKAVNQSTTAAKAANQSATAARQSGTPANQPGTPAKQPAADGKQTNAYSSSKDFQALKNSYRNYRIASAVTGALTPLVSHYLRTAGYEDTRGEKHSSLKESPLDSARNKHQAAGGQEATKQEGGDIFNTISNLELDAQQAEIMGSTFSMQTSAEMMAQRAEQMTHAWFQSIKSAAESITVFDKNTMPQAYLKPVKIDFKTNAAPQIAARMVDDQVPAQQVVDKVKSGEITQGKGEMILKQLSSSPDRAQEAQAALASLNPNAVAPEKRDTKFVKAETQEARTSATVDYADKLLAERQAAPVQAQAPASPKAQAEQLTSEINGKLKELDRQIAAALAPAPREPAPQNFEATPSKAPNTKGQLDYVNKLLEESRPEEKPAVNARTVAANSLEASDPLALEGEQPARTIEEQLAALTRLKDEHMAKLDRLNKTIRSLTETELPAVKERVSKLTAEVDGQIKAIDEKLGKTSDPKEQKALLADKEMLKPVKGLLEKDLNDMTAKLAEVKEARNQVMGELKGVQAQIATLVRKQEVARREEKTNDKEKDGPRVASLSGTAGRAPVVKIARTATLQEKAQRAKDEEEQLLAMARGNGSLGNLGGLS